MRPAAVSVAEKMFALAVEYAPSSIPTACASRYSSAGTAASGRWVVASATRSTCAGVPPTSIMTARVARVRSARNSVWPVNAIPASLMMLFCTGAVTIAANSPDRQPPTAASSVASTALALAGLGLPGATAEATG